MADRQAWKGTLQQYVGRLHRLHDSKRLVRVYHYAGGNVLMPARMYERRLKGYAAIGSGPLAQKLIFGAEVVFAANPQLELC